MKIILTVLFIALACGLAYYFKVINDFKKFLQFEVDVKAHPTDENVKEYMALYNRTYIPNQPKIKDARSNVYRAVKASDQVSYETKKELRKFFEEKEIMVLTTMKKDLPEETEEEIDE